MLQQTRVEHARAYFGPFLERYPTVGALAAAPLEEALAHWSGLGYYRRLRLLHRAAADVVAAGGAIPSSPERLRQLPGVGDYTAAAVASIAFGVAEPVLDGNVVRLLARRLACGEDPARPTVRRRLREEAARWLDADAPGDSNQALMELGARVCTPRAPRCGECPLATGCAALATGTPERYPARARPGAPRRVALLVAIVERGGRVLLFRRGEGEALLAGTWELPWIEHDATAGTAEDAEARLAARYGGRFALGREQGVVRHAITTRRLLATVRAAELLTGSVAEGPEARWVAREELAGLPLSSLVHKALAVADGAPRRVRR
jgi:A/G-specific adenine glycosylase